MQPTSLAINALPVVETSAVWYRAQNSGGGALKLLGRCTAAAPIATVVSVEAGKTQLITCRMCINFNILAHRLNGAHFQQAHIYPAILESHHFTVKYMYELVMVARKHNMGDGLVVAVNPANSINVFHNSHLKYYRKRNIPRSVINRNVTV